MGDLFLRSINIRFYTYSGKAESLQFPSLPTITFSGEQISSSAVDPEDETLNDLSGGS